jgi:hypothetical protein
MKRIDSTKVIQTQKANGNELVTNIRTGATARESLMRHEQGKLSLLWSQREIEEKNAALLVHERIEKDWEKIETVKGPFELFEVLFTY